MSILAGWPLIGSPLQQPFVTRLARICPAAAVAQPQADEVPAALRLREILEGGAAVAECAVVDELHLPGFEVEIRRQRLVLEHIEHRRDRRGALVIHRLAANRVAA